MKVVETINEIREVVKKNRKEDRKISLVPTMGALHRGHISLVEKARENSDIVIMSIFVNPTQFGENEDLNNYPKTLEEDSVLAEEAGVDYIFYPKVDEIYVKTLTYVEVEGLSERLCGGKREGHFRGVTTIVTKLFNIVKPDIALFGLKDVQQIRIIEKMVEDLNFDVKILRGDIARDENGLALSSRNRYLTKSEKYEARYINKTLNYAKEEIKNGVNSATILIDGMKKIIKKTKNLRIDYIEIVDFQNLRSQEELTGEIIIAIAVFINQTRLIDNVIIKI